MRRGALPLGRDAATRTMPWMVAVMVFIAALALVLALAVEGAAARFGAGLAGTVTVEVPPPEDAPDGADRRAVAIAAALGRAAGVASAETIPRARALRMIEPWLGSDLPAGALPLPAMIDVRLADERPASAAALAAVVQPFGADVRVDDHRAALARLIAGTETIRWSAAAVLACVGLGVVLTIMLATRAALAIHRDVIDILHTLGARDGFIARQVQRHAMAIGFQGGAIGSGLAAVLIFALTLRENGPGPSLLPTLPVGLREWVAVAVLPVATAAIAVLVSRVVVMRTLRRML
ncbi:MAG: cell division protein FtsX [Alphaproteobacteria bacterium]